MNNSISSLIGRTLLCGSVCLFSTIGAYAGEEKEEEVFQKESIEMAVKEAQEVAREWATRIQQWKSGEARSTTYMGVVIESVPDVLRDYIDLPKGVGLLLSRIAKDGPAAKAGLQDNDILIKFDDQLVINYSQLSTLIEMKGPGAVVPLTVLRKGEEIQAEVILEERIRKGMQFQIPESPDSTEIPNAEDLGMLMESIDEWIPGSVRVWIDQNEDVHVDLQELKENLNDLQQKLEHIRIFGDEVPDLVREYGDFGARTTVVRVEDKNINFSSKDGKVLLTSSGEGRQAMVWDAEGNLIYQGAISDDYESTLPADAVKLIKALTKSREKLKLNPEEKDIEIHFNRDEVSPVTWVMNE